MFSTAPENLDRNCLPGDSRICCKNGKLDPHMDQRLWLCCSCCAYLHRQRFCFMDDLSFWKPWAQSLGVFNIWSYLSGQNDYTPGSQIDAKSGIYQESKTKNSMRTKSVAVVKFGLLVLTMEAQKQPVFFNYGRVLPLATLDEYRRL